jgi:group I intron endonuclease
MQIYKITNLINNKSYIGQTRYTFEKRYRKTWSKSRTLNRLVKRGVNKYGVENFKIDIIVDLPEFNFDLLNQLEKHYIQLHNTMVPFGYNLESGGNEQKTASKETREKISQSGIGRTPWNKGKQIGPMSDYSIKNSADAHKKSVIGTNLETGEVKFYPSAVDTKLDRFNPTAVGQCARSPFSHKSHYGWKWEYQDPKHIKELGQTKFAIQPGITTKPVIQEDLNSNFVRYFDSMSDAKRLGFNNINKLLDGEIHQIKGFKFRYATQDEINLHTKGNR